jgi:hypothetical protein
VVAGLLLEWQYGVRLAVVEGAIIFPALWRLGLHVGALILLYSAAVFFEDRTESISRLGYGHGVLIAAAGVGVVAVLMLWRVLGAFPPYLSW